MTNRSQGAELWRLIEPYVTRHMAAGVSGTLTIPSGGVTDHGALTGKADDDHLQYHNDTRGDARYYTQASITSWRSSHIANADIHHARLHTLTSTGDHDFSSWDTNYVLRGTGSGTVTIGQLWHSHIYNVGEDDHHNRAHDIEEALDHTVTAAQYSVLSTWGAANTLSMTTATNDVSAGHLLLKSGASGGFTAEQAFFNSVIDTPKITSPGRLNLAAGDYIWTNKGQQSQVFGPNFPINGARIDWGAGEAWFDKLTANEMHVELFVADFIRATVGKQWWSKSVALTSREFIVPPDGEESLLYIENIPGIPSDWQAFENGDTVIMRYADLGETKNIGISVLADITVETGDPGGGSATVHYGEEDFEGFSIGGDPTDWTDTDVNNDTATQDLWDVQSIGGSQAFGTTNSGNNFHTHWTGTGYASLSGYTVTGRFRIGHDDDGWGVTVGSDYPNSDAYYRIRAYSGDRTAHATTHGAPTISGGTSTSSFDPAIDTWYNYRVEFEDTGSQTNIRARFWTGSEPATWDIDCYDSSGGRRTAGTFGMWAHAITDEIYFDDIKCESLTAGGGSGTVVLEPFPHSSVRHGDMVIYTVVAPGASASIATPTGMTSASNTLNAGGAFRTATFVAEYTESFTEPSVTVTSATDTCFVYISAVRGAKSTLWGSGADSGSSASAVLTGRTVNNDKSMILHYVTMPNDPDRYLNRVGSENLDEYSDARTNPTAGFAMFGRYCEVGGYYSGDSIDWGSTADYIVHSLDFESLGIVAGGADIGSVVGTVSGIATSTADGEQRMFFAPLSGEGYEGIKIGKNVAVVDMGEVGDPFILMDAVSSSGPVLEMSTWSSGTNPLDTGNNTTHIVLGRLDDYDGGGTDEFGLMAYSSATKNFKLSTDEFSLTGIPINMYSGSTKTGYLGADGEFNLGQDIQAGHSGRSFQHDVSEGDIIIGKYAVSPFKGIFWDQSAETLSIKGAIDIEWAGLTGKPGNGDIDSMFFGATSPTTPGLFLGGSNMGYHDGTDWRIYFDNTGQMVFGDPGGSEYLVIDADDGVNLSRGVAATWSNKQAVAWWDAVQTRTGDPEAAIWAWESGGDQHLELFSQALSSSEVSYLDLLSQSHSGTTLASIEIISNGAVGTNNYSQIVFTATERYYFESGADIVAADGVQVLDGVFFNTDPPDTNVDGLWFSDTDNRFHFFADSTTDRNPTGYAVGSAQVAMGRLLLRDDRYSSSTTVSGFANIWIDQDDGDLKVTFANGTTRTIATN